MWKKLINLKKNKSPGPEGIHPMLLQSTADNVAKPLADIFAASFAQGLVPSDWRKANISPIFKKGRKDNPNNYRPVSIPNISTVTGTFVPTYFRSQERKYHRWNFRSLVLSLPGTFARWNFRSRERKLRSRERKLHGTFAPWNFRSQELSLPGTFVPWNFRSLEHSLPNAISKNGAFAPQM